MTVVVLTAGGTISSARQPSGVVDYVYGGAEVVAQAPQLAGADLEVVDVHRGSSSDLLPEDAVALAERARAALEDGAEGVVVTHGTDTIEETAYLCDLLAGDATATGGLVFTAAMRNTSEPSADGPRNLWQAVRLAADASSRGIGAVLCVNDEVHAARWVTKLDSTAVAAFGSPGRAPLGRVTDGRLALDVAPPPRPPRGDRVETRVDLVAVHPGQDPAVLGWLADRGARGVVLQGHGSGNLTAAHRPAVEALIGRGVPVVIATRTLTGGVVPTYAGDGGAATLVELGAIPAGTLTAGKARIALMVALGRSDDHAALRAWFAGA